MRHARSEAALRNTDLHFAFAVDAAGSCYIVHDGARNDCSCNAQGATSCRAGAQVLKTVNWPRSDGTWLAKASAPFTVVARNGTFTPTVTVELAHSRGPAHGIDVVTNLMGRPRLCWQGTPLGAMSPCAKPRKGV